MPNRLHATIGGPVSTQDTWSIGIDFSVAGSPPVQSGGAMNALAEMIYNHFHDDFWTATNVPSKVAEGTELSSCNLYQYETSGLVSQGSYSTTPTAGTGVLAKPAYTAMCVTLLTATAGRSGRGRTYLPMTAQDIDVNTLQFLNANQVVTPYGAFLTALNGDAWSAGESLGLPVVAVFSQKNSVLHPILGIRADTIPDTQRGRINRDTAVATYSATL